MTRQEFIDDITQWWELIDFCDENDCDFCSDIYSDDERDEIVNENLLEWARTEIWQDLYNRLDEITTGYSYYRADEHGGWDGLDDYDFDEIKDDVLNWGDENDVWDEEDEDPEEEFFIECNTPVYASLDSETPLEPEDFSVEEFFCSADCLTAIQKSTEDPSRNSNIPKPLVRS